MSDEALKALLGSIEEPESEEYLYKDHYKDGLKNYDFINLINSIGTKDFESIYKMVTNQEFSMDDSRSLARDILEKIHEVYDIEMELSKDTLREEVDGVFRFIEFLEYEYIVFFSHIWTILNYDLRLPIVKYCNENSEKIIEVLDDQIESHFLHPLIADFLRTNNKDNMIELFIRLTEKSKMLIVVEIEREKMK